MSCFFQSSHITLNFGTIRFMTVISDLNFKSYLLESVTRTKMLAFSNDIVDMKKQRQIDNE